MTSITTREIRHEQHRAPFMLQTFISVTTCVELGAFKVSVFSTSPELAGWCPLGTLAQAKLMASERAKLSS